MISKSRVAVALDPDRVKGTTKVVSEIGLPDIHGKTVLLKPNFNTADNPPGSTHIDSLRTMLTILKAKSPAKIIVGDRSGPANTRKVFEQKGVPKLAEEMGFEYVIFDEMPNDQWVKITPPNSHWRDGFLFAKPVLDADAVVTMCCLKTHRYGGHFTMSLKVTTGMVNGRNMFELHTSVVNQRNLIAEMNYAYKPVIAVMDGVEAFYRGGPMTGAVWNPNLTLASADRVALDAVGVAVLKIHGSTNHIMNKKIFEQDQIRRAGELGIGVKSPQEIELVPVDEATKEITKRIQGILLEG